LSPVLTVCDSCNEALLVENGVAPPHARRVENPIPLHDRVAEGSVMEGVLACVTESVEAIPTIPEVPQRLMAAVHDPLMGSGDLSEIIGEDPALSLRVLKLANSVFSSSRHPIADLKRACVRLGMRTMANLSYTVAQQHVYSKLNPAYRELMDDLWRHAVATGRLAELLAQHIHLPESRVLFLAGLTHDIGKTVLLDALTVRYQGRAGRLRESWDLLNKMLIEFAPYAGVQVIRHWGLPAEIWITTYFANAPECAPEALRTECHLIALASTQAEILGFGAVGLADRPDIGDHPSILALGIDPSDVYVVGQEASEQLNAFIEFST
jgi:HD-like signal output (HDOD) protein